MDIPFLNRSAETARILGAVRAKSGSLVVLYGRRRLGKSRLLLEVLKERPAVYYVGDDRNGSLQREDLARHIGLRLDGFDAVRYPDWNTLFERWWSEAPSGTVLALDEFPSLVRGSPELPSVLQKLLDRRTGPRRHLILCGSSQRMMHGLVLDASAPLFGRAREILKIGPLTIGWLRRALRLKSDVAAIDHWAAWGGVPRYWELAADHESRREAIRHLVLDPLGVLHREPQRLLLDDMDNLSRAASILSLVGRGVHRLSEIAGRLEMAATSLSRPMGRLVDLGLIDREYPWGRSARDSKRSRYRIADPFLGFWFRFVEPERSRLEAGQVAQVYEEVEARWPQHLGEVWEDLARQSVARVTVHGRRWHPGSRWWGPGTDRLPLEIDIVAASVEDPRLILCGEVKLTAGERDAARAMHQLQAKARRCPDLQGKQVLCALWVLRRRGGGGRAEVISAKDVMESSLD